MGKIFIINRTIKICTECTLDNLSDIILDSFYFNKNQPSLFNIDKSGYKKDSKKYFSNMELETESTKIKIKDLNLRKRSNFQYIFDFKNMWQFRIRVESTAEYSYCCKPSILESNGKLIQNYSINDRYDKNKYLLYYFRVSLKGEKRINRLIRICSDSTLDDLSNTILDSLYFDEYHLYAFKINDEQYYVDFDGDEMLKSDPNKTTSRKIKEYNFDFYQKLYYWYDFGDDWHFDIFIEDIIPSKSFRNPEIIESFGNLNQYDQPAIIDFENNFK